jgi:DNA-binding transcriptional LysR family regulator
METELGFLLAERKGKSLELTDAGRKLYQHALKITDAMEEAVLEVKEAGTGKKGKLSIGINTLSNYDLPRLLREFQKRFPEVSYKIQQNESAQLCKLLKERVIDLAIVRLPLELDDFDVIQLQPEPFYFVTADPFYTKTSAISLEEISNVPLIIPSTEGLGLYNKIYDAFINSGLKPDIMCECSDISILFDLVSSKFGSTIVPETVVKLNALSDLQVYLIKDTEELGESGIISLKNHYLPKTAQHFINLIHER